MVSFFAIAYNTARLGFEAQNAAAIRLLRLANGVSQVTLDRVPRANYDRCRGPYRSRRHQTEDACR